MFTCVLLSWALKNFGVGSNSRSTEMPFPTAGFLMMTHSWKGSHNFPGSITPSSLDPSTPGLKSLHLHQYERCKPMNHIITHRSTVRLSKPTLCPFSRSVGFCCGVSWVMLWISSAMLCSHLIIQCPSSCLGIPPGLQLPVQKALGFLQVLYRSQNLHLATPRGCLISWDAHIQASESSPR